MQRRPNRPGTREPALWGTLTALWHSFQPRGRSCRSRTCRVRPFGRWHSATESCIRGCARLHVTWCSVATSGDASVYTCRDRHPLVCTVLLRGASTHYTATRVRAGLLLGSGSGELQFLDSAGSSRGGPVTVSSLRCPIRSVSVGRCDAMELVAVALECGEVVVGSLSGLHFTPLKRFHTAGVPIDTFVVTS